MIRNIIVDMGGVLLDIDETLMRQAFHQLGCHHFDEIYAQFYRDDLFDLFESGKISSECFRHNIKNKFTLPNISDENFDRAWNKMLIGFSYEKIMRLRALKSQHRLFLFSNTNEIHYREISFFCRRDLGMDHLGEIFEQVYFSHLLGYRKPNPRGFELILLENELNPSETLFVDDTLLHIETARALGLKTILFDRIQGSIDDIVSFL